MQAQTTTTTTTTHVPNLNSEAYNYANAANRIAAHAAQQLRAARKSYKLTNEQDLSLSYCASYARAAAKKACEAASNARAQRPGSELHRYLTKRAADAAATCEKYADRLANLLAEIEMGEDDDETGW